MAGGAFAVGLAIGACAPAAAAAGDTATGQQVAQSAATQDFSIPPQALPAALDRFATEAGISFAYRTGDLSALRSPGVTGRMSMVDALQRLLVGTGVEFRFTDARTVTLTRAADSGAGLTTLTPITVEGSGETADGPVAGYIATRSATGTKTDTPLIETPQSISVIGATQIERQNAQTVGDALAYTPGILRSQGFNRTDDGFYIRGFQGNADSIYMNGLRNQPNIYSTATEPYLLERIEVLHGPASVLYGQSSPGGVINLVTKKPVVEPVHEVAAELGSFDRRQLAADLGGALDAEGTFSYRLTALARDSDTMVDYIPDDKAVIAPAVTWRPSDATSLTVLGNYNRTDTMYYYGFPAVGTVDSNPNGQIATSRFIGEPDFNKWKRTTWGLGYEFAHRFDDALFGSPLKLRQNLRYSSFHNEYNDIWFGTYLAGDRRITRGAYSRDDKSSILSVDTNLETTLPTGPLEHTLLAGLDVTRSAFSRVQYNGTVAPLDLYAPVYGSAVTLAATPGTDADQSMNQVGLYAQDQIRLGDHWRFLLGGRNDWAEDETDNHRAGLVTKTKQSDFTGRAGIVYLTDIGLAPYVSYAESFLPQAGTDASGDGFDPTTAQQYEAGLKYEPTALLDASLTVAVYQLTRQNVLTPDPNNAGFSVQTGEIRSRGVELEGKIAPAAGLTILAGYAFTDAEVTKSNGADLGTRPENTPRHMASLWADYELPGSLLKGLRLGGGVRYVGDTVDLNDTVKVPSYVVADAMLGYEWQGWGLSLNVVNLFDKTYVAACTYGCFYGDTRTVTAKLNYRW